MTIYSVYKTTNNINGKFYIGAHATENPNDDYLGSGDLIKAAKKKYGIENFSKEILYITNTEKEMYDKEKELIEIGPRSYNIALGGKGAGSGKNSSNWGLKRSEETKQKMSEAKKGKKYSQYHIDKIAVGHAKEWIITYPDGHEEKITNAAKFCRENNLSKGHLTSGTKGYKAKYA